MSEQESSREELILKAVKTVLTNVVKDTATAPGLKHPLGDNTLVGIRDCLSLISQREQELATEAGREMNMRPRFIDEPAPQGEVVIPLDKIVRSKKKDIPDK
jgi:hypothetical protein